MVIFFNVHHFPFENYQMQHQKSPPSPLFHLHQHHHLNYKTHIFKVEVQIITSTCLGNRLLLYLFKILKLMLKAYSDATIVIRILSKSLVMTNKYEKCCLLLFHHSRTSIPYSNINMQCWSSKYISSWVFYILGVA